MKPKESDFDKLGETYQGLPSLDARWRESIPRTLGTYELLAELGGGGFGAVFQCRHQTLRQERAIKVLDPRIAAEPGEKERFFREARVLAGLENVPEVVKIYDLSPADSAWSWLVMEYVPGMTMEDGHVAVTAAHALAWYKQRNGESRGMPEAMVKRIFQDVLRGLAAAHSQGIIHRDLKPGNILLTADGGAKLGDFGLVKLMDGGAKDKELAHASSHLLHLPQSRPYMGTTAYMSPEQEEGKPLDARSDIYSLGLVIYELLVGHRAKGRFKFPYEKGLVAESWWDEVLEKMLEVNPGERFDTSNNLLQCFTDSLHTLEAPKIKKPKILTPQTNLHNQLVKDSSSGVTLSNCEYLQTMAYSQSKNEKITQHSVIKKNSYIFILFEKFHKHLYFLILSLILTLCLLYTAEQTGYFLNYLKNGENNPFVKFLSLSEPLYYQFLFTSASMILLSLKRYSWHLIPIFLLVSILSWIWIYNPTNIARTFFLYDTENFTCIYTNSSNYISHHIVSITSFFLIVYCIINQRNAFIANSKIKI